MSKIVNVIGFAGSLRRASYNKALLQAAVELAPENMRIEVFDLEGIPPFNQDFEKQPPEIVREFKVKIRAADAVLMVTPEYNYSIPGVLKNAIDWASRPYGDNVFEGKSVAIMGASTGILGSARAQYHLRQCFVFLNMHPLNKPEVMVTYAAEKFDNNGRLTDEDTRKHIAALLQSFIEWTEKFQKK